MLMLRPHDGQKLYVVTWRHRVRLPLVKYTTTPITADLIDNRNAMRHFDDDADTRPFVAEDGSTPTLTGFFRAPVLEGNPEGDPGEAYAVYNAIVGSTFPTGREREYYSRDESIEGIEDVDEPLALEG